MKRNIFVITLFGVLLCMPQLVTAQSYSVAGNAFREEGIASWYGAEFDGRPTASGEIFNSTQFTAAHPTLPFGTFLVVTNKHNNRQVTVKVNDRGPFVASRIIDLSRAAAEHIDMVYAGTAPVIISTMPGSYFQAPIQAAPAAPVYIQPEMPQPPVTMYTPDPIVPPTPSPAPGAYPYPPITLNVYAPSATQPQPPVYVEPAAPPAPVYVEPYVDPYASAQPPILVPPPAIYDPYLAPPPVVAQPPAPVYVEPQYVPPAPLPQPQYIEPQYAAPAPPLYGEPQYLPPAPLPPAPIAPPPVAPMPGPTYVEAPLPSPTVAPSSGVKLTPTINLSSDAMYRLQVGSYKTPRNAVDAFEKLKKAGLNPAYEQNGDYYRVVLTGIRGAEVSSITDKLEKAGFREAVIRAE